MIINEIYQKLVSIPLKLLVSSKLVPDDPVKDLKLDPHAPIYYVLQRRSTSSFVMLQEKAKLLNLPEPKLISGSSEKIENGSVFFLQNKAMFGFGGKLVDKYQKLLERLVSQQKLDPQTQHQLIPVSIYWGRNPGKEQSLLRLLFTDTESATIFRKFFLFLFQGRNSFVRFATPVNLNTIIKPEVKEQTIVTKLTRILRVHFHRHRQVAMGPLISNRRQVITNVVVSRNVKKAIEREASSKQISLDKAKSQAEKYATEIASAYSYKTIRIMESTLTHLWNRIYDGVEVRNAEMVRGLATTHEIIYLPCHRSHIDYLLLSYTLYHEGLVPPHIAAGINLNFWPAGPILRRGGAFFLRRSFGGNKLYTAVFNEYIFQLMDRGIPLEFFPEGGRSRTGRLLPPKTGLLAMTVQSCLRGTRKPIAIIPVYIGYERMFEGKSYLAELRGAEKKKESFGQLLGLRKTLKQAFGKVYLNFASPLMLNDYLDQTQPEWKSFRGQANAKPTWLTSQVTDLADILMQRINTSVTLNSVSLVGLVLLGTERLSIDAKELEKMLTLLLALAKKAPYSEQTYLPETSPIELISQAEKLRTIYRIENPMGEIVSTDEQSAILLTYYRNNILHLYITPALIASCFLNKPSMARSTIIKELTQLYPLVKKELFLRWSVEDFKDQLNENIAVMLESGLLIEKENTLSRASESVEASEQLNMLAQFARPTLFRYGIIISLLSSKAGKGNISRQEIENRSQQLAQRIAVLYSLNAPESFDKKLFRNTMSVLRDHKLITITEDNNFMVEPSLNTLQSIILDKVNTNSKLILQKTADWADEYWQEE
ncbi:glycerol-3-phosphate 1-O-acyltransferase PlsB [Aliikangiella marina]|uniref:Glycerol-3-phosphate acyltransferase n=1 Tax=Aliikangiella marina TaxID=1712262 RepID=A0A545T972_9GAMM|nr:glycerol-3-phosphate 1-O-acyltransferase PlsB [Aliikangiella marina]TQV73767.1 glycerol-3-phosphate 1-O-acyltransferase PlsB [Aliikangiella marina]